MLEAQRSFLDATLPHLDAVHAVARRLTSDRSAAEDLVQETYLRAFAAFPGHHGESTRAWLTAICVNVARGEWRRRSRRVTEVPLEEPRSDAAPTDVERDVEASLERDAVVRALAQLPQEQRLAIVLMDIAGNTASEVAAIVGSPRGTVLARAHRGRRRLAVLLGAQGVGHDLP